MKASSAVAGLSGVQDSLYPLLGYQEECLS